jgi:Mrp family chromosome partitioning ATPase
LRDYLGVARRRKWLIALAIVIVPVLAVGLSLQQRKMYRASAQVLLATSNVANQLNGITDPAQDAARRAQTQADLARVPAVARETLKIARVRRTVDDFLKHSSAIAQTNADLLVLAADDHDPAVARRLASSYAIAFSRYRGQLDTAPYENARTRANKQLAELAVSDGPESAAYQALLAKRNQLDQYIALLNQNAVPVKPADTASQIEPRPVRTGILGLVLGIVLGLALAFLKEALDTKVRSAEEIESHLGLPLLARIPEPPRKLRKHDRPVMLAEPNSPQAEIFRLLRTNLEFVRLPHSPRTILVTSALEREGKSTTCANLAITLARAGQRVALVDLDLRRPYLDRFFDLTGQPGLTQVALRRADFEDLLAHPMAFTSNSAASNGAAPSENGSGSRIKEGELVVVGTGPIPPNAGEFVSTPAVWRILDELRTRFDTVLIDTPPALQVGDAMAISTHVDAVVVVCRMNVVRRPTLTELRRALDACPAEKLGFVLAGAQSEDGYGYHAGAYYYKPAEVPEAVDVT